MKLALRFLGVGSAQAVELGSSNAAIERDGQPLLMVDCGPEGLTAWLATYGEVPAAVFVTHGHMDHVGGLERLFYRVYFDPQRRGRVRLYVPVGVIGVVHDRLATYPNAIAEGSGNFWDAFQLIPVQRGFWHEGLWFDVLPVRHHAPGSAFGLGLRGALVWTGDTRPIPETLAAYGSGSELVAHDCTLHGNPSHTGVDDLEREYPAALRARFVLYHYGSAAEGDALRARGHRVAAAGERFELPASQPAADAGRG
jgi:ribonuclease BN (tRNA processing enzyme)